VLKYYNFKTDGFFIEIGAYDGVELSNTLALEQLGWKGICVEPLPHLQESLQKNRTCQIFNCAISSSNGHKEFVVADVLSGFSDTLDTLRVSKERGTCKTITVETMTFDDLLAKANAPEFIDFLSLDTEGSEFDILQSLDHSKYKFGFITVEHNGKQPARENIKTFLISKGYKYKRPNKIDDEYIFNRTSVD
jgi:FkbM family methyltransferase